MKNVLEWLEESAGVRPDKRIYGDTDTSVSVLEVMKKAQAIGTGLDKELTTNKPVAVFMDRKAKTPISFLGVVYSGRCYAPIDSKLPAGRIEKILNMVNPEVIVTEKALLETVNGYANGKKILLYEDLETVAADEARLRVIRNEMITEDPLYMIFTSGSSGNPKGVITSHKSLMTYINAYTKVMQIEENDVLGNQSPLDYIAAIRDIYIPMKLGCETVIIPKEYFMEPKNLFDFMNDKGVTSVAWSVSAFTILNSLGAFDGCELKYLKKVCFSGSVMPCKVLKVWQENLPECNFVNQYGPTETTASCTYYEVDHVVEEDEVLPIGNAYDGYRVFLLKEDDSFANEGEEGEICVVGPALALGYYNDPERTSQSFVVNPNEKGFVQRMYRTGDIGVYEKGNLWFHGRKDRQIKHMGHRVELDEVEYAANQVEGVDESCVIYIKAKEKLVLFYTGEADVKTISLELRKLLPGFMVPRKIKKVEQIEKLPNTKINYKKMEELV